MKRLEYLKLSIQWKCYRRVDWFTTAFAVFREEQEAWKRDSYPGRIVSNPWGYSFVNQQLELEKIEDAKPNEPLFNMSICAKVWCVIHCLFIFNFIF